MMYLVQQGSNDCLKCFVAMAAVFPASQAIVLGGGLAGVSAANTILECGGNVVLLDKSRRVSGRESAVAS